MAALCAAICLAIGLAPFPAFVPPFTRPPTTRTLSPPPPAPAFFPTPPLSALWMASIDTTGVFPSLNYQGAKASPVWNGTTPWAMLDFAANLATSGRSDLTVLTAEVRQWWV